MTRFDPPVILCTDWCGTVGRALDGLCTEHLVALHLCHELEDFSFDTIQCR